MKNASWSFIKKQVLYDKKNFFRMLPLLIFSTTLVALFPLVTQFFIKILYNSSVRFLVFGTIAVIFIYVLKLFADIHFQKFENKLYLKIQSNIQGALMEKFLRSKSSFTYVYSFVDKKTRLFMLFVKQVLMRNIRAVIKIVALLITIAFYDSHLFIYSLFFIPIFFLYVFLFKKVFFAHQKKSSRFRDTSFDNELIPYLHNYFSLDFSFGLALKNYKRVESIQLEKELRNRNSLVGLNQSLRFVITLFRILYLAYFGYFILTAGLHIEGLIVGLLFITILVSSCTQILESLLFIFITRDAVDSLAKKLS
ncbi:MAG: hypothetical protein ACOCQQ_00160 [Candidatus Nanoarchaeia archaeon]